MKRFLIFPILFFTVFSALNAQSKVKKSKVIFNDSISQAVHQIIKKHAQISLEEDIIDALSIGILYNGVHFMEHYGDLKLGESSKPNHQTIYEIASVTKTFTGTLAAQAVLEGKISLEEPINKYLPKEYDFSNLNYEGSPIQIQHLLTHTSRLPSNNKGFKDIPKGLSEKKRAEIYFKNEQRQTKALFFQYLSEVQLDTLPGTRFNYSNFGTNLMAYILEKAYEKPFQDLIHQEIIQKAGMNETTFRLNEAETQRLAIGYDGAGFPMRPLPLANTLWGAEGALKSTLPDMIKYIRFQMNEQNPIVKEAHRKIYEIDPDYWIGYFWWTIHNGNQDLHFRHDGGALGTRNVLLIYPEAKIGISIFTNKATEGVFENLSKLAKAIYIDLK